MPFQVGPIDVVFTVGAIVLGLGALAVMGKHYRSYEITRVVDTGEHLAEQGLMTVGDCSKRVSKKCCKAAAVAGGFVDADSFHNCNLCNHPNCDSYELTGPLSQGDPTLSPFDSILTPPSVTHGHSPQETLSNYGENCPPGARGHCRAASRSPSPSGAFGGSSRPFYSAR